MIDRLIGHTAAYTFANLVSRGTVLVWLIVLPSFLPPADYGALGLVMTTAALVNVVVPLEVSQSVGRYYATAEGAEKRGYAASAWTFTVVMLGIAAAVAFAASGPLSRLLFGSGRYVTVFRVAVAFFVLNTGFYFIQNQLRWDFRSRDYTVVSLLFALVTLGSSVGLAVAIPNALLGVVTGLVIGAALGVLFGVLRLKGTLGLGIDPSLLKRMFAFSLPLVPASVAVFLSTYVGRFVLRDLLDLREVGLFTWASQIAAIPALMLLGVQAALTPLVMRHHAEEDTPPILARAFEGTVAVQLWLCVALGLFTPDFIHLLGYASYAGAGPLVILLAPALLMLQLYVFAPGFAIAERTDLQLIVSLIGAAASIGLNFALVSLIGITGAAMATLFASGLFLASWLWLSNRLYPIPVRWRRLAVFAMAVVLAGVAGTHIPNNLRAAELALKAIMLTGLAGGVAVLRLLPLKHIRSLLRASASRLGLSY